MTFFREKYRRMVDFRVNCRTVSMIIRPNITGMYRVFLLLGTNVGDRLRNLEEALRLINERTGQLVRKSSVYRTAAWGKTDQPDFYNQVAELLTRLQAEELLREVLNIERDMGRQRTEKWGERVIDIDILFFGNLQIEHDGLSVPHPQIAYRRFTLVPLAEIADTLIHPRLNKTINTLLSECPDTLPVTRLEL